MHPGIYQFAGVLKSELQNARDKMEQFEHGRLENTQSVKARTLLVSRQKCIKLDRKYLCTHGQLNLMQKQRGWNQGAGRTANVDEEGRVNNDVRRVPVLGRGPTRYQKGFFS